MRGISKAIQRGPQQVKNIINKNNQERDLDFKGLEENVNKIQVQVKNLLTDSDKFKKTIENMMNHQEELGNSFLDMLKPISSLESPLNSNEEISKRSSIYSNHSVGEQIQADTRKIDIYLQKTKLMKDQIFPYLQNINFHVIEPMKGYQDIIHSVKQVLKKRSHKALDYDRHKDSLDKLSSKQSRSLDEERKLNKTREAFTTAELEFKTYDDQLKQQLPSFFDCSSHLYDSCLITFYSIQKDVYHILYVYFYEMVNECGLNMNTDIIEQYESFDCPQYLEDSKVDSLNRLLTVSHGIPPSSSTYSANNPDQISQSGSTYDTTRRASYSRNDPAPPSYETSVAQKRASYSAGSYGAPASTYGAPASTYGAPASTYGAPASTYGAAAAPSIPSRPAPALPQRRSVQYVTALYDFTAQNAGDISFKRGDRIEIVKKTDNANEWWTGKINGQVGQFPGNYVQ